MAEEPTEPNVRRRNWWKGCGLMAGGAVAAFFGIVYAGAYSMFGPTNDPSEPFVVLVIAVAGVVAGFWGLRLLLSRSSRKED